MNKIFTQLVNQRHLNDDFLYPKYENLSDPFSLNDMEKAVARIETAIKKREKILIYGDYDVDGVTASTLMAETLELAKLPSENIEIMLPDRFIDGYGMSPRLIERATNDDVNLVITVDCGSRNHAIVDELNTRKIDVIITDHHECEDILPEAVAVINPKRHDSTAKEELKDLAGVGVAFKLAEALVNKNFIQKGQEKWLLDLVLLGTICDQMFLSRENRILTFYGVKVLEKTRRKGLKALMKTAGVSRVTSEAIGFQLGPRLNSSGRLETAELSLNLLRTSSTPEAVALAEKLEALNQKRRKEQHAATDEIAARFKEREEKHEASTPVIVETGNWHEGILGIVAGRLVETYKRPAFVLSKVENNIYKGSGRSFGDFSLAKALDFAKDAIISGGGHAAAAGVRVDGKNLYAFREKINAYYESLNLKDQAHFLKSRADLEINELKDFTLDFLEELHLLEPFGAGNEEPVFRLTGAKIINKKRLGADGKHLRLDLKSQDGKTLKAIAFFAPDAWFALDEGEPYDFLLKPVENEFRGTRSIEARLIGLEKSCE